jgi:manganese-dependent inorganic pyrophosphatase
MIKVFGHQNPDTDTVGCAILWAWYLSAHTTTPATPYRLGDLNNETAFILKKWGIPTPDLLESVGSDDVVTIVDTNNPAELFPTINDATIIEVIDHHKLFGGLTTKKPPVITMRPLASTASVIYDLIWLTVIGKTCCVHHSNRYLWHHRCKTQPIQKVVFTIQTDISGTIYSLNTIQSR